MRRGFTFLEIIISLSIILVIALLGVTSFGSARNNIDVKLQVDEIVNELNVMREKARSSSVCTGFAFIKNGPAKPFTSPYDATLRRCGSGISMVNYEVPFTRNGTQVSSIQVDGSDKDNFTITFEPPQGRVLFNPDGAKAELKFTSPKFPLNSYSITISAVGFKIEKR